MIEQLQLDLIHFTTQRGFFTDLPTIYHPWDLQHIHLPLFFTAYERKQRDSIYQALCQRSTMVAAASSWIKNDLILQYQISEEKIWVVPMASVLADYPPLDADELMLFKRRLPARFAYYPAQTWEHKNHLRLLDAMALLRDQYNTIIPLVLSGGFNAYGQIVLQHVKKLNLEEQVTVLGYVSAAHVQVLYELCDMLVFPSQFEGWGLPITEAMAAGVPIACSNATHLPKLVGDAGIVFDPLDTNEIARAIHRIWTDENVKQRLITCGLKRSQLFSWANTARLFHLHYQRILGNSLTEDDLALLNQNPVV